MKKPKMILKVDRNNMAKLYFNKKWHKDITALKITAVPWEYYVEIEKYKHNDKGLCYVENNEIARKTETYRFGERS